MTINLNDRVKVKLTDWGKDVYRSAYFNLNKVLCRQIFTAKQAEPKVDNEGYTAFQLWDFINLFGNYMGMCEPNVIEPLDLVVITRGKNDKH